MNEVSYAQNNLSLIQTIESYWIYILGIILVILGYYFTKTTKTVKNLFKGG